ncbi:unnamed protein product [Paramecium sonneborni]|uniref:EF-hand domain-containing protein n=1 Tax=Paramecium sonneborni TaxID=65129 RepID=A0A8S1LJE3_9CILI|nr:unnamed protein product [Paramecium sonneborni]
MAEDLEIALKMKELKQNLKKLINYAGIEDNDQDMIDTFIEIEEMKTLQEIIIKNEFELTIDIEELVKEVDTDGSGVIEFRQFKELLKTNYLQEDENDYP